MRKKRVGFGDKNSAGNEWRTSVSLHTEPSAQAPAQPEPSPSSSTLRAHRVHAASTLQFAPEVVRARPPPRVSHRAGARGRRGRGQVAERGPVRWPWRRERGRSANLRAKGEGGGARGGLGGGGEAGGVAHAQRLSARRAAGARARRRVRVHLAHRARCVRAARALPDLLGLRRGGARGQRQPRRARPLCALRAATQPRRGSGCAAGAVR